MSTKTASTIETFSVVLDPKVSLQDQIQAGNYGSVDKQFTPKNFKLALIGNREIVLFDPGCVTSSRKMIARMKAGGFVPATIDDCLALGATFPERQRKNPIAFLGTVWPDPNDYRHVPVLNVWNNKRELLLNLFGRSWHDYYRFAAVRES
jgi:hypothetical protein